MQLIINDQSIEATDVSATETVLSFLRRSGFTGTKEGCASGDCGACTVMIGRPKGDKTVYHTINACIAPIAQYAGDHIVTVEGLADEDGTLHPAQRAMVDCHGSQCGFCTPGFVMSLAALTESLDGEALEPGEKLRQVREAISGNLCRCTGYKPILKAGEQALDAGIATLIQPPAFEKQDSSLPTGFFQPTSVDELNEALNTIPSARLVAGGTDLMLEITQLYKEFDGLIDVTHVGEMQVLDDNGTTTLIGAAVSYTRLEDFFATSSPQLVRLLHRLGSKQIRNSGSIGGNLGNGSPIADIPPVLLIWNASINVGNADGSRRSVAITDFYNGYRDIALEAGEYIISVQFPSAALKQFHRLYKNSKRIEDDISSIMGAFTFTITDSAIESARVAYGGMAATPIRLEAVEAELVGKSLDKTTIENACVLASEHLKPMTDVRATAEYRKAMALQMLARALREANGEELLDITEVSIGTEVQS